MKYDRIPAQNCCEENSRNQKYPKYQAATLLWNQNQQNNLKFIIYK